MINLKNNLRISALLKFDISCDWFIKTLFGLFSTNFSIGKLLSILFSFLVKLLFSFKSKSLEKSLGDLDLEIDLDSGKGEYLLLSLFILESFIIKFSELKLILIIKFNLEKK